MCINDKLTSVLLLWIKYLLFYFKIHAASRCFFFWRNSLKVNFLKLWKPQASNTGGAQLQQRAQLISAPAELHVRPHFPWDNINLQRKWKVRGRWWILSGGRRIPAVADAASLMLSFFFFFFIALSSTTALLLAVKRPDVLISAPWNKPFRTCV